MSSIVYSVCLFPHLSPCVRSGELERTSLLATVYLMAVTRLTGSEAVRAVLADQLEPLTWLAEEVEGRLVDWEWEVAGLVRERLRLATLGQGGEEVWAEHRLELYYTVREGGYRHITVSLRL